MVVLVLPIISLAEVMMVKVVHLVVMGLEYLVPHQEVQMAMDQHPLAGGLLQVQAFSQMVLIMDKVAHLEPVERHLGMALKVDRTFMPTQVAA